MLYISAVPAFNDNYIWLIKAVHTNEVLIVDPGDAFPVIIAIKQQRLIPSAILITHNHHDHVGGIETLLKEYNVPVHGPSRQSDIAISHPLNQDNLVINTAFPAIGVLNLPGHTADHIAFLLDDCLFCGDTLFGGGCGRLLGGTAEQLFQSLQQIAKLPQATKIYCAHEYTEANLKFAATVEPDNKAIWQRIDATAELRQQNLPSIPSTLALELATNPFLRCDHDGVIQSVEQFSGESLPSKIQVFAALRRWKDSF